MSATLDLDAPPGRVEAGRQPERRRRRAWPGGRWSSGCGRPAPGPAGPSRPAGRPGSRSSSTRTPCDSAGPRPAGRPRRPRRSGRRGRGPGRRPARTGGAARRSRRAGRPRASRSSNDSASGPIPRCQSWTVDRMPARGLRTSWATPASSLPSAASRSRPPQLGLEPVALGGLAADGPRQAERQGQGQRDPAQGQPGRRAGSPGASGRGRAGRPAGSSSRSRRRPGRRPRPAPCGWPRCSAATSSTTNRSRFLRIAASTWISIRSASRGGGPCRPAPVAASSSRAGPARSGRRRRGTACGRGGSSPPRPRRTAPGPRRPRPRAGGRGRPTRSWSQLGNSPGRGRQQRLAPRRPASSPARARTAPAEARRPSRATTDALGRPEGHQRGDEQGDDRPDLDRRAALASASAVPRPVRPRRSLAIVPSNRRGRGPSAPTVRERQAVRASPSRPARPGGKPPAGRGDSAQIRRPEIGEKPPEFRRFRVGTARALGTDRRGEIRRDRTTIQTIEPGGRT